MSTCAKCGATSAEGASFCQSCGTSLSASSGATQEKPASGANAGIPPNAAALLCYILWPIACLLFLILDPYNKDKFVRFHAFQALFLGLAVGAVAIILAIVTAILGVIPIVGWILDFLIWIVFGVALLGLVIFSMYKAYNGERYLLPWIGNLAAQQSEKMP